MIHIIGIILVLVVIGVLLYAKFHNSKVVDKLTHDLTTEETHDFKETLNLIKNAQQAENALDQRVENNAKVIKQVEKDTESIKKHQEIDIIPHLQEDVEAPEGRE